MRRFAAIAGWVLLTLVIAQSIWRVAGDLRMVRPTTWLKPLPSNEAVQAEARFGPLRQVLPPHGAVGYLTAIAPSETAAMHSRLFLVRYTLAPRAVLQSTDVPLVVADLPDDAALQHVVSTGRFELLAKAGPGVAVLRNREARR